MDGMNRTTVRRTGAVALEKALEYAEAAEHCDTAQQYEDRDVRLRFAEVWARIASAALLQESNDPQTARRNPG